MRCTQWQIRCAFNRFCKRTLRHEAIYARQQTNGTNGNTVKDERGLLPYPVIIAATKDDADAMAFVIKRYESSIADLSMRKLRDERGNAYFGLDGDIHDRLRLKLMQALQKARR